MNQSSLDDFKRTHKKTLSDLYYAYHLDGDTVPTKIPQRISVCLGDPEDHSLSWRTSHYSTTQQYADREWWLLDWNNREWEHTIIVSGCRAWVNQLLRPNCPTYGYPSQREAITTRLLHLDLDPIKGVVPDYYWLDKLRGCKFWVAPGKKGYQAVVIFSEPQPAVVLRWVASTIAEEAELHGWHLDRTNVGDYVDGRIRQSGYCSLPVLGPLHRKRNIGYVAETGERLWTLDHDLTDAWVAHYSGDYAVGLYDLTRAFPPAQTLRDWLKSDTPEPVVDTDTALSAATDSQTEDETDIPSFDEAKEAVVSALRSVGHAPNPLPEWIEEGQFSRFVGDYHRMTPEYIARVSPDHKADERIREWWAYMKRHTPTTSTGVGTRCSIDSRVSRAADGPVTNALVERLLAFSVETITETQRVKGSALKARRLQAISTATLATFAARRDTSNPFVLTVLRAATIAGWDFGTYITRQAALAAFHKAVYAPVMRVLGTQVRDEAGDRLWAFNPAVYQHQRYGMGLWGMTPLACSIVGMYRAAMRVVSGAIAWVSGVFYSLDGLVGIERNSGPRVVFKGVAPMRC